MKKILRKIFICAPLFFSLPALATPDIYVIQLVLDGLRPDVLERHIEAGDLPHLQEYFAKHGIKYDKATTTFPTVSSPGYVSFLTGQPAGESGIFFLEWFDRTKGKPIGYLTAKHYLQVNQDIKGITLYEKLAPLSTAAVLVPYNRGASIKTPQFPLKFLWSGLTHNGVMINQVAMDQLFKLLNQPVEKIPRYTMVGLFGTDLSGHSYGPDSKNMTKVLRRFDQNFQRLLESLRAKGIEEKTTFIISSDHGMHETGKVFKIKDLLWKNGIDKTSKVYADNRGVSSTYLTIGKENDWEQRPTIKDLHHFPTRLQPIDLIALFQQRKEVAWVAAPDGFDQVRVFSKNGTGSIRRSTVQGKGFFQYDFSGEDPLGNGSQIPNAIAEVGNLFQDPKAGDLFIQLNAPWSLRKKKAATHGSLIPEDMQIVLWIGGPTIRPGHRSPIRSTDLYSMILAWFDGKKI